MSGARSGWRAAGSALLLMLTGTLALSAEGPSLEGDPFRGRELLSEKLCVQCHSVWGQGGAVGPDLSTAVTDKKWLDVVGDFWNHTPRMIDAMGRRGYSWPRLDRTEMADLLTYLYYLRLFDEPGNATRGSTIYAQLGCASCHSLGSDRVARGLPLDAFSAYPSPVMLAQAMWNAGPAMQRDQLARGGGIPEFSGGEMADLQAHIRAQGLRTDRRVDLLPLPDPDRGSRVFVAKRCLDCHRGRVGEGPNLDAASLHLTAAQISGILWNHSYAMHDRMRARGIPFPTFSGTEMADLIAYLHFLGFFAEAGDAARGEAVFAERGCSSCHGGAGQTAPDLAGNKVALDPVALSAAMWNHSPEMHRLMSEQSVAWPKFDAGDMEHLATYLRKLATGAADRRPSD